MKHLKKFKLIDNYNIWKNSNNYIVPNVSLIDNEDYIINYNPLIIINPLVTMNGWIYGEIASNPVISGNTGNGTVTYMYKVSSADDSTYTSTKPTDAGTYTIKANINAIRDYGAGSCTSTFTIVKANINPSVTIEDWDEGDTASNPIINGNTGNGTVTYMYKVSSADDSTYTSTVPSTEGIYTIKATIDATSNYNGAICTTTFNINSGANPLIAKYNVTSTATPTQLYNSSNWGSNDVKSMKVDGVEQEIMNSHTFDTVGEHTVLFTLKEGVTSLDTYAFKNCSKLTSITIPDSVTLIGPEAFSGCSELTSVTIPNSVRDIDRDTFKNCSKLTSITIPSKSITTISAGAFDSCTGLTSITIPDSVLGIGNYAFSGCTGLTSVTIPNLVSGIGNHTFSGCTGLTSVTIGNSVTSLDNYVFYGCSGLTSITIPDSVTSIGDNAFSGCSKLTSITIPDSVISIGEDVFSSCSGLTSVTIGNSVKSISNYTFMSCIGLTSVIIGNSVTSIGNYAFSGCTGLTSITIPDSVTSIGDNAFNDCRGLTSVIIGTGVTTIGQQAFYYCDQLNHIKINRLTAPTISSTTFWGVNTCGVLVVPSASNSGYNTWMSNSGYYLGYYRWLKVTNDGNIGTEELTGLYWSKSSLNVTSSYYTLPTLTKPSGITVYYSSSDTNVATVNDSTGAVTIRSTSSSDHDGTTYISAIFSGNSTYRPKKVEYTLNVDLYTPPSSGGGSYGGGE